MNKLHANRIDIEPDHSTTAKGLSPINLSNDHGITHSIRIEVYRGNEYIGKKIYSQDQIIIGKSLEADLVLSDMEIADQHACISFIDGQPVIFDRTQQAALMINGVLCGIAMINSSENIGIGPYNLKISCHKRVSDQKSAQHISFEDYVNKYKKLFSRSEISATPESMQDDSLEKDQKDIDPIKEEENPEVDLFALLEGSQAEDHALYDLVFEGNIQTGFDINNVKSNLSKILKSDASRIESFLNQKRVVLKRGLEIDHAEKYKNAFEKSGALCRLIEHDSNKKHDIFSQKEGTENSPVSTPESPVEIVKEEQNDVFEKKQDIDSGKQIENEPIEEKAVWKFYGVDVEEEDDEDEEDLPAGFYLKDRINDLTSSSSGQNFLNGKYLEILKLSGDDVIDIQHLSEKNKFYILDDNGKRFCLAEFKGVNEALFYFNKKIQGSIAANRQQPVETDLLINDENCINKRKKIYRVQIPKNGKVVVSDGYFEYQLRIVGRSLIPETPEIKKSHKKSCRHLGVSVVFHIVFFAFLGLIPSFQNEKIEDETRFVKLDTNQLAELEKLTEPQPKPEPPKPAPVVETKPTKVAESKVTKKTACQDSFKKKPSKVQTASGPDKHPDAGGGFGVGNVETRNINETGILSMIGDSVGIQPRSALAAVTNLDAVSSPNVSASNLKVGGVVGKLGTGEIAVPKGAIISTKGSSQVLRSHGRKGEGTVAALEKGTTGEQEVMGMVTATLDKSARIRGGLSMDAVKRVIDQHLDDITYCYETELISNPSIVGKVLFEWKILMSGEVGEVRIKSSSINSHEIHACIKEAIRTWRFPKPRGSEVIVSYPFVFDIVGF